MDSTTMPQDSERLTAVLQERARHLAARRPDTADAENTGASALAPGGMLLIRVENETFGLPLIRVSGVLPAVRHPYTPIPGAPIALLGLINVQSAALPLFDAAPLLLGSAPAVDVTIAEHIVLVQEPSGRNALGLRVGRAERVADTAGYEAAADRDGNAPAAHPLARAVLTPRPQEGTRAVPASSAASVVTLLDPDRLLLSLLEEKGSTGAASRRAASVGPQRR